MMLKNCGYCNGRLGLDERHKKYHGNKEVIDTCAYFAYKEMERKHWQKKKDKKEYIQCREALNSGYF